LLVVSFVNPTSSAIPSCVEQVIHISPAQRAYLIGKIYRETKVTDAFKGNQYTGGANNLPQQKTAEKIAEQFNVSHQTVKNAEKFADAVDTLAEQFNVSDRTNAPFSRPISGVVDTQTPGKPHGLKSTIRRCVEEVIRPSPLPRWVP
jgi:hypothetical protein